jgi:hypothetical protein
VRAEDVGELGADDHVGFDGHFGRGGFAGADGPDGLVGDDDASERQLRRDAGEGAGELGEQHGGGLAGFALGEDFADADDGDDAVLERGVELLVDDFVGLVEVLAALGVADEGVGAPTALSMAAEVSPV